MPYQHSCPRCHTLLVHEDGNSLLYCFHCGAPQVLLSEELRSAAEQIDTHPAGPDAPAAVPGVFAPPASPAIPWNSLIRSAALFSSVFSIFVLAVPPLALFVAPAALSLFATRHREVRITTKLGTRFGLLCGVFCAFASSLLETIAMLMLRFSGQGANPIDERLAYVKEQALAQSGQAAADKLQWIFTVPDFRAGMVLSIFAIIIAIILLFATAGGTLAGYLRSRRSHAH